MEYYYTDPDEVFKQLLLFYNNEKTAVCPEREITEVALQTHTFGFKPFSATAFKICFLSTKIYTFLNDVFLGTFLFWINLIVKILSFTGCQGCN